MDCFNCIYKDCILEDGEVVDEQSEILDQEALLNNLSGAPGRKATIQRYRLKHLDTIRTRQRIYAKERYLQNPEKGREKAKKYYESHKEKKKEKAREWYRKNKETILAKKREKRHESKT